MHTYPLYLIPLLPLAGAAINLLIGRKLSRAWVQFVAIAAVAASFGVVLWLVGGPLWEAYRHWHSGSGPRPALADPVYTWITAGRLHLELAFRLDTLSAVMVLVVTFVGSLIHIYSTGYMAEDPRYAAYFGYLNLFTGAMLILVLAANLPVMFIGWEGVGLCSYLLIGFWFDKEANANAGRKAFICNRIGDFAFLLGMFLLFYSTGTLTFEHYRSAAAQHVFVQPYLGGEHLSLFAGVLLFIGATGKSAQIPLYVWLPDAMAGPTPVSALIHAATMVTAGVYMVTRLGFLYASSTTAMAIVAGVGAITALFAAIMAFAQTDVKKVLAYSTISQLGFMFTAVGVGAYVGGIFHLVTHAFFKAGLFLGAGSIMHAMGGSGDIRKMGGLRKKLPKTHISFLIYCLAISGIFPFSGFFSKDEILSGAFNASAQGWWIGYGTFLWVVLTLAAFGTAFYIFRLYFLIFAGECRADEETKAHIHESSSSMTTPLLVLAAFSCVLGFIGLPHLGFLERVGLPNVLSEWLAPSIKTGVVPEHLADGRTLTLIGLALAIGIIAIGVAYKLYGRGPSETVERLTTRGVGHRVYVVVKNKFYVDEFYDLVVVRPFRWTARLLFQVVDRFVVDLLFVNGSAKVVDLCGRVVRWFQNGNVHRYLVALVVGGTLVFYCASRPPADFTYHQLAGTEVQFRADLGAGPGAVGAKVGWDFDGDGKVDSTSLKPTWVFGGTGHYRVTMWLTDGAFGNKGKITKTITVHGAPTAMRSARGSAVPRGAGLAPPARGGNR